MIDKNKDPAVDSFDVGRLMDPTDQTRQAFEEVLANLSPFADRAHSKSTEVMFANPEVSGSINVYCGQSERISAGEPEENAISRSTLVVRVDHDETHFMLGYGHTSPDETQKATLETLLEKISERLDDPDKAWLHEACSDAQLTEHSLLPLSVAALLEKSPYHVYDHTLFLITKPDFSNGSSLNGNWIVADERFFSEMPPSDAIMQLDLKTSSGTEYEYSACVDGTERLLVKKPGERVIREVDSTAPIESDTGRGISMSLRGSEEFLRAIRAEAAEHQEVREKGLDQVTDGSLSDFTEDLRAALNAA